jgi:hypothetical protein
MIRSSLVVWKDEGIATLGAGYCIAPLLVRKGKEEEYR